MDLPFASDELVAGYVEIALIFAAQLVATINTRRFGDPLARNGLQTGPKNNLMIESPRIWIGMAPLVTSSIPGSF